MAKKDVNSAYQDRLDYQKKLEAIHGELSNMRYADLQRACIIRGIDFDFLVSCDVGGLHTWVIKHWDDLIIQDRLKQFDDWRETYLKALGKENEPFVRLGYLGEPDPKTGEVEDIKHKKVNSKLKDKKEKDEQTGVFKGTKKALTFQLVKEGNQQEDIIAKVMEKYPDAKDKSIKIWIKKAIKTI